MPAFNHERYIGEALQSVGEQTYRNIELIVIDDGSTDGTPGVIEAYIEKNSGRKIRYVSKANEGVCRTLNLGLGMATGDYVAILASDDVWLPERLARQLEFMENNRHVGMVFADAWFIDYTRRTYARWSDYKPEIRNLFKNGIQESDLYARMLTQPLIPALTVLVRRSVLLEVGFFDDSLAYEDHDLWLRIAMKYPLGYIDSPLACYRLHGTNISNDTVFMLRGMWQTVRKHLKTGPLRNSSRWRKSIVLSQLAANLLVNRLKKMTRRQTGRG
jgi:glycosyltransferase involved in cell wall biosynthesis